MINNEILLDATGLSSPLRFEVWSHVLLPKSPKDVSVLTFIESDKYLHLQDTLTPDDVVLVPPSLKSAITNTRHVVTSPDPKVAFFQLHNFLARRHEQGLQKTMVSGTATISSNCFIDDYGVEIGEDCVIEPNVVILRGTSISPGSVIRAGAVIGANGFEQKRTASGMLSVLHYGETFIGLEVEVGSNCTVARGLVPGAPTSIGNYSRVDSNTFIAHGSRVGERVLIAAGVSISGSVVVHNDVWIGPGATLSNGITIGEGAWVGMGSNQFDSVAPRKRVIGRPSVRRLYEI